jgi:DNA-binding NtrC family response regulator
MRVLLVDDEGSVRMTLAANLELEGFEVVEASNGRSALEVVGREPIDLVLTDVRMPGMNGVELFRCLRQERPGVPVVLMTAFALEDLVEAAVGEGAFTVLPKPFTVDHVVATLVRASRRPVVLVVDGTADDADSTAGTLRGAGIAARAVADADAALAVLRDDAVDVCVAEIGMAAFVERLLAAEPRISVIAVSWHAASGLFRTLTAAGAFACLSKPFRTADLVRTIARARGSPPPRRAEGLRR